IGANLSLEKNAPPSGGAHGFDQVAAFSAPGSVRSGNLLFGEQLLQLARLIHLHHDVAAADELALYVELGDGRPVGERLDALANLRVLQNVHAVIGHAAMIEDRDGPTGEAALREKRRAL